MLYHSFVKTLVITYQNYSLVHNKMSATHKASVLFIFLQFLIKIPNLNAFVDKFQANTLNTNDVSADENGKKQPFAIKNVEKIEIESLSSEVEHHKSNEWSDIELDDNNDKKNTYYQVNNANSDEEIEDFETVTHDLSDDIAINQMLADQSAPHNPDAEVFDIHQFDVSKVATHEDKPSSEQESFDYQPYQHFDKQTSAIK